MIELGAHGTNRRYKQGCSCRRCRKAHSLYQRQHSLARGAAYVRLSREFPERFQAILAEEKAARGIRMGPGRPPKVDA